MRWFGVSVILLTGFSAVLRCSADTFSDLAAQLWKHTNSDGENENLSAIVPQSDIRQTNRTIWIITTACLPWMTGTSINPLLRAAHLTTDRPKGKVHLMVPWLQREEQDTAYPPGLRFDNPDQQRAYVLRWLRDEAHMPAAALKLNITFYAASYHDEYHSIFPMGDITELIPDEEADICVLEEPEHLNWYKAPFTAKAWMEKFNHVVGIIHTNYLSYTRSYTLGALKEPLLYFINQGMCRAYCHKIIKLSNALQEFAVEKEITANVHGVRNRYLLAGDRAANHKFTKGAYFVGKMAWPKGLDELFRLMQYLEKRTGNGVPMDLYGQGPHFDEIKAAAEANNLPVTFHGAKDHSLLTDYRVFVNPSLSEVLCTTIVEALAMGKWVVCAKHPSNEFFEQFPNCLTFRSEEEFAANVFWALNHDPQPLSREHRRSLSWEAAMERFMNSAIMTVEEQRRSQSYTDKFLAWLLEALTSGQHGDLVRLMAGGRSAAMQLDHISKYGSARPVVDDDSAATKIDIGTLGEEIVKQSASDRETASV